mgnify:CR=1 FL=1
MNWINSVVRPKIRSILRKKDMPDNLWVKCPETGQMIYYKDLEANQFVVPGSNYHMRMAAAARLKLLFDDGDYESLPLPEVPVDPLKFRDERRYTDRLKDARGKTGLTDAVLAGAGRLEGQRIMAAVQDFDFLGGSLGTAAGEAVITAMRAAVKRGTPFREAHGVVAGLVREEAAALVSEERVVSDWMRAVPDQIARWVPQPWTSLGADGFGFADTRAAARRFFQIDTASIVVGVLEALAATGEVKAETAAEAYARFRLDDPTAVADVPQEGSDA